MRALPRRMSTLLPIAFVLRSSSWPRSVQPRPRGRKSLPSRDDDVDGFGVRIEHDLRLGPLELSIHVRQLLLEREIMLAVLGALAQHKRLHDAAQGFRGELGVGNEQRFLGLVAQFLSLPMSR